MNASTSHTYTRSTFYGFRFIFVSLLMLFSQFFLWEFIRFTRWKRLFWKEYFVHSFHTSCWCSWCISHYSRQHQMDFWWILSAFMFQHKQNDESIVTLRFFTNSIHRRRVWINQWGFFLWLTVSKVKHTKCSWSLNGHRLGLRWLAKVSRFGAIALSVCFIISGWLINKVFNSLQLSSIWTR